MLSKDRDIRLLQLKLKNMGSRKSLYEEYKKKTMDELLDLQDKGKDYISSAMAKLSDNPTPEYEKKFDDFIIRFEVLEDAISFKRLEEIGY